MTFIEEIKKLTVEHQLANYNQFNIFKVMFKQHDEKYLHSRFISFLLDPDGSHKQGTKFLELFFEVMDISNFSLEGIKVNPNERKRKEEYNIDILIRNAFNHAIIVENKFFAKDQTKPSSEEIAAEPLLKYQLTRYYHKIAIKEKHEIVTMIYLSIDGKDPEDFKKFPPEVRRLISTKDHLSDIAAWLDLCIKQLHEDFDLKRSIQHYKQVRFEILNDVQLALRLKNLTSQYLVEAKQFWISGSVDPDLKIVQNQFKHVKWHTIHEFYVKLANAISATFIVDVNNIDNEHITKLTHKNKETSTSLIFNLEGVLYYVCNDKNGFSIGRDVESKKNDIDYMFLFEKKYVFFDFTKPEVFQLVNTNESEKVAGEIVNALKNFINK